MDVLVVGAGLSGLLAASVLQSQGWRVTVVDKGRSVGGRLATRRVGPGRADHGAQFFSVRTPHFRDWVDQWLAENLVYRWSTGWSNGSIDVSGSGGYARYAVAGGMNRLAKRLASGLNVRINIRIKSVSATSGGWQAEDEHGQTFDGRALLLTPPVPQLLALLDAGSSWLSAEDREALERVEYAPCLAGLFRIEGSVNLPPPGAIQRPEAPISWLADNRQKGISPEATIVTVHAGPAFSRQRWHAPKAEVLSLMKDALEPFLPEVARVKEAQLKRWRYALSTTLHPESCLRAADLPPLVFAGDAFGGPRMEGAALSGLAAAQALRKALAQAR